MVPNPWGVTFTRKTILFPYTMRMNWVVLMTLDDEFNLTMVADLSHWINVAETDTNDPDLTAVIEALAPRFRHIHLRVGYDHGPQVVI